MNLAKHGVKLRSADSMAWSFDARRSRTGPMKGCEHAKCNNCKRYALWWRERLLKRVGDAA